MPLQFPLKVRRYGGILGQTSAFIITDAAGRSINISCDPNPRRREVAKVWSPEYAEALAKHIARMLSDNWAEQVAVYQNAHGEKRKRKP
jgi:hypothetical protein